MITITVKTPFDKDITLEWSDMKATVKGSEEALLYWKLMEAKGLYGMYGYGLDMQDCYFRDLLSAVLNRADLGEVSFNKEAQRQIDKEAKEEKENPTPKDSLR